MLNRNPDNYFAETEQSAFHPGHLVPGIDFSSAPLLQGRLFAYSDAQVARLGGPNHHELPINRSLCPMHNFMRDGAHRMGIPWGGAVNYEPNSLGNGMEFRVDGGQLGFQPVPETFEPPKTRRRSPAFDDHFSQATLFWSSQPQPEKDEIVAACQYQLSRVESAAVRQRVVDNLAHVDLRLARKVAEPLGIGAPDPRAAAGQAGFRDSRGNATLETAPSLAADHTPTAANLAIATRKIAILVANGVEVGAMKVLQQALHERGAVTCVVAAQLGVVTTSSGQQLTVHHPLSTMPSVMFDAVMVPGGAASTELLSRHGEAVRFVQEAYRHGKALCLIGESERLLRLPGSPAPGVVRGTNDPVGRLPMAQAFIAAIARHRHGPRPGLDSTPS